MSEGRVTSREGLATEHGPQEPPLVPRSAIVGAVVQDGVPPYYGRQQLKEAPFNNWVVGGYIFLAGLSGASALLTAAGNLGRGRPRKAGPLPVAAGTPRLRAASLLLGRCVPALSGAASLAVLAGSALLHVSIMAASDVSARRPEISRGYTQPDYLPE